MIGAYKRALPVSNGKVVIFGREDADSDVLGDARWHCCSAHAIDVQDRLFVRVLIMFIVSCVSIRMQSSPETAVKLATDPHPFKVSQLTSCTLPASRSCVEFPLSVTQDAGKETSGAVIPSKRTPLDRRSHERSIHGTLCLLGRCNESRNGKLSDIMQRPERLLAFC